MIVDSMINEASLVRPESFNVKSLNLQLINSLPPSGYWARKPVSNWLSLGNVETSFPATLAYSPVSLYKQRESWITHRLREESPAPPLFIEEVAAKLTEEFL